MFKIYHEIASAVNISRNIIEHLFEMSVVNLLFLASPLSSLSSVILGYGPYCSRDEVHWFIYSFEVSQ